MKRKHFRSFFFAITATLASYLGIANPVDPAVLLSKLDFPEDIVISEIENDSKEKILLKAGNEKYGMNHILQRHSKNYFPGETKKGIPFPDGTSGLQIIKGIEQVYKFGEADPKGYGNKKVLQHQLSLNGEDSKYRLVINDDNEIITFYKLRK